jgi:hypothetical protein
MKWAFTILAFSLSYDQAPMSDHLGQIHVSQIFSANLDVTTKRFDSEAGCRTARRFALLKRKDPTKCRQVSE